VASIKDFDRQLLGLLDGLYVSPDDPACLAALADYLSELGPTPVRPGDVPDWLRLAWLASLRRDRAEGLRGVSRFSSSALYPFLYSTSGAIHGRTGRAVQSGWAVREDISGWLSERRPPGSDLGLDYDGSTVVGGLTCWVNEPYPTCDDALAQARRQAAALTARNECVGVGLRESYHGHGTFRVLLLPPAEAR
jgi:hypothetical protein